MEWACSLRLCFIPKIDQKYCISFVKCINNLKIAVSILLIFEYNVIMLYHSNKVGVGLVSSLSKKKVSRNILVLGF